MDQDDMDERDSAPDIDLGLFFIRSAERHGDRPFLVRLDESGDAAETIRYREAREIVEQIAAGLQSIGIASGDRVALFAPNSPRWVLVDLAMQTAGVISVPIYTTIDREQATHIINNSGARTLIVGSRETSGIAREIAKYTPDVSTLIHLGAFPEKPQDHRKHVSWDELLDLGREGRSTETESPDRKSIPPDDPATLIYTSGTTGMPKGVMISHRNILSNVRSLKDAFDITDHDRFLSILPLSHAFERTVGCYLPIGAGAAVAYPPGIEALDVSLKGFRPTVMVVVPRILETIYAQISSRLEQGPTHIRKFFSLAHRLGLREMELRMRGQKIPAFLRLQNSILDLFVFSRFRERFGGAIKYIACGGAPLKRELGMFFHAAGLPVMEGYGLTETGPVLTVNRPQSFRYGTVGTALEHTEITIDEEGEIIVRGPQVSRGYYNDPDATAETFTDDGWFHTGDIGSLTGDGYLLITDRKKDIIITRGGKCVAPQRIENTLVLDPFIHQAVVVGENRRFLCALIVPNMPRLADWARDCGVSFSREGELLDHTSVREYYESRIEEAQALLPRFEKVRKFTLMWEPFTEDKGEVTPSLKIKRNVIMRRYAGIIDRMYKSD